jgi:hypothetical protein
LLSDSASYLKRKIRVPPKLLHIVLLKVSEATTNFRRVVVSGAEVVEAEIGVVLFAAIQR